MQELIKELPPTEEKVKTILKLLQTNTIEQISKDLKVSPSQINKIIMTTRKALIERGTKNPEMKDKIQDHINKYLSPNDLDEELIENKTTYKFIIEVEVGELLSKYELYDILQDFIINHGNDYLPDEINIISVDPE